MKNITILGATGSIGLNTLSVIDLHQDKYRVFALSANTNWQTMLTLCRTYEPKYAVMADPSAAQELQNNLISDTIILSGEAALIELAASPEADYVMAAIVGAVGMASTLAAARAGKRIMLANKESLVVFGNKIINECEVNNTELIPIDSEHFSLFTALKNIERNNISRVFLTASGGPFRNYNLQKLKKATLKKALKQLETESESHSKV